MWIQDNHPIELISPSWIHQKLNYIHFNPVRANIVRSPAEYVYSSAANYLGKEGVMEVSVIDLGMTEGYVFLGN